LVVQDSSSVGADEGYSGCSSVGADEVAVQAALQWGADEVAVQAALQWGLMM
jgi:hypothetical protein